MLAQRRNTTVARDDGHVDDTPLEKLTYSERQVAAICRRRRKAVFRMRATSMKAFPCDICTGVARCALSYNN